jgi:hypothetical protein
MGHISFLGVPVDGEIVRGGRQYRDQRPMGELEEILRPLMESDGIHDFGWAQYTPYFNDGDECIFGVHGFWVRTPADVITKKKELDPEWLRKSLSHMIEFIRDEFGELSTESQRKLMDGVRALDLEPPSKDDDDDDGDDDEESFSELFGVSYGHPTLGTIENHYGTSIPLGYNGPNEALFRACLAAETAIEGGEFEEALLEAFGDHAEITVTKEKIEVAFYEHD